MSKNFGRTAEDVGADRWSMCEPIPQVIGAIREGKMVVVVDDEDRENEGDLVMAADHVTATAVNFMATHGRGLVCAPISVARARALKLRMMTETTDRFGTAFTVSVDARDGIATGISAADRAHTIRLLADPRTTPHDLHMPGHVFPLVARDGGVLTRPGHTEAALDLARLAGCSETAVICEIMNDDGTMSRVPELDVFVRKHNLKLCSIADLVRHRRQDSPIRFEHHT